MRTFFPVRFISRALALGAIVAVAFGSLLAPSRAFATPPNTWTGEYWNLGDGCPWEPTFPTGAADLTRQDKNVDFDWGDGSPDPSITPDCFAARWTKTVSFTAGTQVFHVNSDDGVRVYIDGTRIIDGWGGGTYSQSYAMTAGNHEVKVEYFEDGGSAHIHFSWHTPYASNTTWGTNGTVYSVARGDDGTMYIGGDFTYVGQNTGEGVPLDSTTGQISGTFPQVLNGDVLTSLSDGSGGWYIGGNFTSVGDFPRNGLAHILSDGTVDPNWNPDVSGQVYAMAGGESSSVYIGGNFTTVDGQTRNYIAQIGSDGHVTSWDSNANNQVKSLLNIDGTLVAGGSFTTIGGQDRQYLAMIDGTTGLATDWNPSPNNIPYAIGFAGGNLYVGGDFTSIAGQTRHYIAQFGIDGSLTEWDPNANSDVRTIATDGSTIYVGGYFTTIGGQSRDRIAALDATTGDATEWNPDSDNYVGTLMVSGGTVYAGGYFSNIGGQARNNVAALDETTGLATSWNPNASNIVETLSLYGTKIYAGGGFFSIGGQTRNRLAALDPTTGEATPWNPSADGTVFSLAVSGSTVYAGGSFSQLGGHNRSDIGAIDAATGDVNDWNPGANNTVRTLLATDSTIYAGGDFSSIGGAARNNIAALDPSSGLATNWNPNADNEIDTMVMGDGGLFVGGYFRNIGNANRGYLAQLNTTTGNATDWDASANSDVLSLALSGTTLYAGGDFTILGRGTLRQYIGAVDAATGVATDWNPGSDDSVVSILPTDSAIYAGGYFGTIGGQSRSYLAALDPVTGNATDWNPSPDSMVRDMLIHGNTLWTVGEFQNIEKLHLHVASIDISDVAFTASAGAGSESVTTVNIPISITHALPDDVTVDYSATGGTATGDGTDYTLADGTATIPAGETSTTIPLSIVNDTLLEGNETVEITLSNPSDNATIGANKVFTYTIQDDDYLGYQSHDMTVTPDSPGTLYSDTAVTSTIDEQYWTTALSQTDGGYDSQVFKFKPDMSGSSGPTFDVSWTGHGDTPDDKLVHLSFWNFSKSQWDEVASDHCSDDCTLTGEKTGAEYKDSDGYVWIWAKADNQYGPPAISNVSDNSGLLPITWDTDNEGTSMLAYDTKSHSNWDDYASHISDGSMVTSHGLTPSMFNNGVKAWQDIASATTGPADGEKLVAVVNGGDIWTSTDGGITWTDRVSAGSRAWISVASSADGVDLAAAVDGGHIWTSIDSGATWTQQAGSPSTSWRSIASSDNGQKLVAGSWGGPIYYSIDGGVNWLDSGSGNSTWYYGIASSGDGDRVVASAWNGVGEYTGVYDEEGGTWTWSSNTPVSYSQAVASSSDGMDVAIGGWCGPIYVSTDGGSNFSDSGSGGHCWSGLVSSRDGNKLVGTESGGNIYIGTFNVDHWDWTSVMAVTGQQWVSVTGSSDLSKIQAIVNGGDVFTSEDGGATFADRTGTKWYYRVRSVNESGDVVTSDEYSLVYSPSSSCPFVYTYDGTKYNFIIDASSSANLAVGLDKDLWAANPWYKDPNSGSYPNPLAYATIPHGELVPRTAGSETYYDIKTTTELNEVDYFDQSQLQVIDHDPSVAVYPDYRNNGQLHSVSVSAPAPVSVTDQNGTDVKSLVASNDDHYWHSDMRATPSYLTIKLTNDVTTPANLKLVIKRGKEGPIGSKGSDILQYKNSSGAFVNVPAQYDPFNVTRDGTSHVSRNLVNTYGVETSVIDLSGLAIKDNTIRLITTNALRQWDIDWLAVDTSADSVGTVSTLSPYSADLHARGVSDMVPTNPGDKNMQLTQPDYSQVAKTFGQGNPLTGNATKYGDVAPLLESVDNKFVVMVQGDELGLKYHVPAQADGTVRDFVYKTWDYHKASHSALGDTIDPLPFNEMTSYPYHDTEHYPTDDDHAAYLAQYNTRAINWGTAQVPQMHHSLNTDQILLTVPHSDAVSPTVTTGSSSAITATTATLSGNLTDIGSDPVTVRGFNYGRTLDYGSQTVDSGDGFDTGAFSSTASSLSCGTQYHYQAYATNASGTALGDDAAFTTLGCSGGTTSGGSGGGWVPTPSSSSKGTTNGTVPAGSSSQDQGNAGGSNYHFPRTQKTGVSGIDVTILQQFLNNHGFAVAPTGPGSKGKETKTFSAKTKTALMKYQKSKGLKPDGILGPKTRATIEGDMKK